ncbi:MAG: radical SAM protein [Candidatus Bathyarchaeia archaeon]|nr:radical SAM protein [Candidatus Bathyarchaeota archaeon]
MTRLVNLFNYKKTVLSRLERLLDDKSKLAASSDHHSRRRPRPCGITIHTGVGCSYICAYCYIYDMGFPARTRPYPLKPEEMTYALALNPYVIPEKTLAAYGSVTEPFLRETATQALSYMREIYMWLRLPTQVSTKAILTENISKGISSGDPRTSVLVTVVTISNRSVEPRAPDPMERIKSAGEASRAGLSVSLFMRPIIPGITDVEAEKILSLAAESGLKSIVLGSLRVTERILRNLERYGANVGEIRRRLTGPIKGSEQIEIRLSDFKRRIKLIAEDMGFIVFRTACEANVYTHGRYCAMCNMGPCNTNVKPEPIEASDIEDLLEYLGVQYASVEVTNDSIRVTLKGKQEGDKLESILTLATYRRALLKFS